MIIEYKFKTQGGETVEGMRTELDRNYGDEETALVFIENERCADTEGYFELNLRKDTEGRLTGGGYVCEYESSDQNEPACIYTDIELSVTEHDFDETLARANETLLPYGMEIVLEYDGELYWAIASRRKGGGDEQWYAEGEFAHEVSRDIDECLAHVLARVKNPELVREAGDEPRYTQKQMENAVMLAADLYQRLYDSDPERLRGGALEVAGTIISEAVKMEAWLAEKYGPDDEEYLDRLEEYEARLVEEYDLPNKKQIYTVSYVGLSDSEYEANGYCETFVYRSQEQAEAKLKAMRDAEIENCKAEGRDYEILKDEPMEFRMSWCCHGEQIRIKITDDYMAE